MMNRRLKMFLLALGVIGGYGSGFAHMHQCREWRERHRQQVMSEFAKTCVDAARTQTAPPAPTNAAQPL